MSDPGTVLYITWDGLLEPLGASQVLPYVRGVAEAGIRIDVLSFEKPEDLRRTAAVASLETELEGRGIGWHRRRWHRGPTLVATLFDVWTGRRALRRWLARRDGPVIVHARGYIAALIGLAAGGRARLLADLRGLWVDERIEGGYWAPDGVETRIGRAVERRILSGADHFVSLTRKGAARLPELAEGVEETPVAVIPTCVDTGRYRPPDDPAGARRARGLGEGPVLIHVGTITGWYDAPATMAVAAAFIRETGGEFVILTRDVAAAAAAATAAGVRARIETAMPDEVPGWLAAADAGLAMVRPSASKDASFPTKIAEYLACGLAVLSTPHGDLPELADDRVLTLMDPGTGSVTEAARRLAKMAADPERRARARAFAEARLSLSSGVARLLEVYAGLGVTARPSASARSASR